MDAALLARVRGANKDINQEEDRSHYTYTHQVRTMLKAPVKIREEMESCIALNDFYNCGK